jgi:transcriptional regulator with GAF, ATPase, and Fis domain
MLVTMTSRDHPTESLAGPRDRGATPIRARLRTVAPRGVRWRLEVLGSPLTLGRAPDDATTPLIHGTVSRRHARITWDAERRAHVAEDLGSRHGTHVDGAPAGTGAVLGDGAILRLGGIFLAYERVGDDVDPVEVSKEQLPGEAPAIVALRAQVARAAIDPSPVLVVGATGTGKEWVAGELHRLSGRRGALVAVNCAALAPQLVESQLFGHVKGAFTGATTDSDGLFRAAHGGTLLLDEVGELPLELQPKLLRVLQDGIVQPVGGTKTVQVDVRVIAATNRDVVVMVELNRFRRDLHARLAKWELAVPPLAARRGDQPMWLERLWAQWCTTRHVERAMPELSAAAMAAVLAHPWPDNLRGLDRLVHDLASRTFAAEVDLGDLPSWIRSGVQVPASSPPAQARSPVPTREEFEAAWKELGGNVRALGKKLGRDRRQIYRWAEAYGLRPSGGDDDDKD